MSGLGYLTSYDGNTKREFYASCILMFLLLVSFLFTPMYDVTTIPSDTEIKLDSISTIFYCEVRVLHA